jgi:hypothetical protein
LENIGDYAFGKNNLTEIDTSQNTTFKLISSDGVTELINAENHPEDTIN